MSRISEVSGVMRQILRRPTPVESVAFGISGVFGISVQHSVICRRDVKYLTFLKFYFETAKIQIVTYK